MIKAYNKRTLDGTYGNNSYDDMRSLLNLSRLLKEQEDEKGYIMIKTYKTGKYGRWLVDIDNVNKTLAEIWPYG